MNSYQCFRFILRSMVLSLDFFVVMSVLSSTPSHDFWAFLVDRARGEEGMHMHLYVLGAEGSHTGEGHHESVLSRIQKSVMKCLGCPLTDNVKDKKGRDA